MKKRAGVILGQMAVAMAILVILCSYGITNVDTFKHPSQNAAAMQNINALAGFISQYRYQTGSYPPNLEALTVKKGVYGPWILKLPTEDPWGTKSAGIDGNGGTSAYCYAKSANGFAVWSLGKNQANNSGGGGNVLPTAFGGDDVGVLGQ
ncbi:MAG: type II secretion system GspH family protein [Sporomusaceae bacterium]|jgi:type II secretory pathway pseudopilin PulG|nr:type II secretion system GspH family protein [Sporomusaceae bacterium]